MAKKEKKEEEKKDNVPTKYQVVDAIIEKYKLRLLTGSTENQIKQKKALESMKGDILKLIK